MAAEQEGLSEEQVKNLQTRGEAQIVTNDLENAGRLIDPTDKRYGNNPAMEYVNDDQERFDALEAAKKGDLSKITDEAERAELKTRFEEEGQKGLEALAEKKQKEVTTGPVDADKLGAKVAEAEFGTDSRGTEKMAQGTQAAKEGIEKALGQ